MHKSPHARDPLPKLAAELTTDAWLLCFDEFQVLFLVFILQLKTRFLETAMMKVKVGKVGKLGKWNSTKFWPDFTLFFLASWHVTFLSSLPTFP